MRSAIGIAREMRNMREIKTRCFLCVVCEKNEIVEILEETYEDGIPDMLIGNISGDVSNCDLIRNINYTVTGGKLLVRKPAVPWNSKDFFAGGVCDECIQNNIVQALFRHIAFE